MSIKGYISAIKDPSGCRITESKKISETFRQYYERLYSSDINTQSKSENTFFKDKINDTQKELLEDLMGIQWNFFTIMNDNISLYLLKAINTSFQASKLPNYMNIVNITVIHTKKRIQRNAALTDQSVC